MRALVAIEYPDGTVEVTVLDRLVDVNRYDSSNGISVQTVIEVVAAGEVTRSAGPRPRWFPDPAIPAPRRSIEPPR